MTTNVGTPVVSNQNSESIGRRGACYLSLHGFELLEVALVCASCEAVAKMHCIAGPVLMEDYHLVEKLAQVGNLFLLVARTYRFPLKFSVRSFSCCQILRVVQFNRGKIPERVVHARGMTAKGYFEVGTNSWCNLYLRNYSKLCFSSTKTYVLFASMCA